MNLIDPMIELASAILADGHSLDEAVKQTGLRRERIKYALNIDGFRDRDKARRRRTNSSMDRRGGHRNVCPPRNLIDYNDNRAAANAYTRPEPVQCGPSLPKISILAKPYDATPVRKLRLVTPVKAAPETGADRWRAIHREMIRRGRLPEPGVKTITDTLHQ